MKRKLKIFIIAGEVSGDVLGAKIMAELPGVEFIGIGGENMQRAGLKSLFPISDLAVMGFVEVLARAKTLTARINQAADAIVKEKPDVVLTVDAPSFATRVIKKVKSEIRNQESEIKFFHVVAPQVWAWGPKRAKKFAKIFDRLYAFFDFEVPYFTKYGLDTIAVGHPIADGLKPSAKKFDPREQTVALIPGSRISEVKKLLPLMGAAARKLCHQHPEVCYNFYIPVVETTEKYVRSQVNTWGIKPKMVPAAKRYEFFAKTDIAIAASGTVSAELAIMHIPAVIVYKMNWLTQFLAQFVIRVKWVSLVNILLNKTVYPELLGDGATIDNIFREIEKLSQSAVRKKMISELKSADKLWHRGAPAAKLIARSINP